MRSKRTARAERDCFRSRRSTTNEGPGGLLDRLWAIRIEHELGSAKHHLDALGRAIAAGGLPPG